MARIDADESSIREIRGEKGLRAAQPTIFVATVNTSSTFHDGRDSRIPPFVVPSLTGRARAFSSNAAKPRPPKGGTTNDSANRSHRRRPGTAPEEAILQYSAEKPKAFLLTPFSLSEFWKVVIDFATRAKSLC